MQALLRYRKTVGALLAVVAFVFQWTVVDGLEAKSKSVFPSASFATGEVNEHSLELLYLNTQDLRFLEAALQAASMRFTVLHLSPAFQEATKESRFQVLLQAMQGKPTSWDDYLSRKQSFLREMGKFWNDEWRKGAAKAQRYASFAKVVTFIVSLVGLLLVWSAEAFPSKSASNGSHAA
ncbi:MAG: hypothetical protein JNN30_21155 [Rhodanobacteraceae bacterium]|nr:hypothetical protein [Rhodanobacteraceae bacterium]